MNDSQQLIGKRVLLRKLRPEDASERYVSWLNDPEVNRFVESRFVHWTLDSVREYVRARQNAHEHFFAICDRESSEHIGNAKLGPINTHHQNADVSLFIGERSYWGRGIASEVIGLLSAFAFEQVGLRKLQAGAYATNLGSIRAFEKNGYAREGLQRERCLYAGKPEDLVILGCTRSDYMNRKRR